MTDQPPVFTRFADLMRLEPHGPDVFVGESPEYPWGGGRVYGGQVVAQAMKAAVATVDPIYRPHSLHAYFIRGGTSAEPIRFEVDRIRNGRSFCTRRVVARQSNGAILNVAASFHVLEDGPDVAPSPLPDDVPPPDELDADDWGPMMQARVVPAGALGTRQARWIRVPGDHDAEIAGHELALLYASDDVPYEAASRIRPDHVDGRDAETERAFVGASLDHAVWFHRHASAAEWQLHVLDGLTHVGNRGLAFGQVYALDGTHVASVAQEIVHRRNERNG